MGRLTEYDKKYIQENSRLTNKELAAILKHDPHTIGKYKQKLGVAFTQTHDFSKWIPYINDNRDKKTAAQLAKEIGCSKAYVTKTWAQSGFDKKISHSYYCNENFFNSIDNGDKAYIIGFLASDGNLYKREHHQGQIQITLKLDDIQILEDIKVVLGSNHPIKIAYGNRNTCTLTIVSDRIYNDLLKIGLSERKTWDLYIEQIFQMIPMNYWKDFLRGYLDGDGSIHIGKNISDSTVSIALPEYGAKTFLKAIKILIDEEFNFTKDNRSEKYNLPFGSINTKNTTQKYLLLKLIYMDANLKLKRKLDNANILIERIEKNVTNRSENVTAVIKWGELLGRLKGESAAEP